MFAVFLSPGIKSESTLLTRPILVSSSLQSERDVRRIIRRMTMMMLCLLVSWTIVSSAAGLRLDHFHCRTATCNEFFYVSLVLSLSSLRRCSSRVFVISLIRKTTSTCVTRLSPVSKRSPSNTASVSMSKANNSMRRVSVRRSLSLSLNDRRSFLSVSDALAETMRTCIGGLKDVPEKFSRHFCGHRLMQNCARHVGLERFPYIADYRHPNDQ